MDNRQEDDGKILGDDLPPGASPPRARAWLRRLRSWAFSLRSSDGPGRATSRGFWLLLALHVFLAFQGIAGEFLVGHEANGAAQRSIIARNYLRYGLLETGGKPLVDPGYIAEPRRRAVHWHHPPGANLLVAASFAAFGENEAAARLVPVTFGIAALWFLYLLARERYGPTTALVTGVVYTLLPQRLTYGNMVNYEVPLTALVLLAMVLLERHRRGEGRAWLNGGGMLVALAAAVFVDWPAAIFAAFVGLDALLRRPRRPVLFLLVGLVSAATLVVVFLWVSDGYRDNLMQMARLRTGDKAGAVVTFGEFHDRMALYVRRGYGPVAALSAILWVAVQLGRGRFDPVISVFGLGTVLYLALFRQAATVHEFYLLYLAPAMALGAAAGITELVRAVEGRTRAGLVGGVLFVYLGMEVPRLVAADAHASAMVPMKGFGTATLAARDWIEPARLIARETRPTDLVQIHTSLPESIPFDFYSGRASRRTSSLGPVKGARVLVARESAVSLDVQRRLAHAHAVTLLPGYLVVDLQGKPGSVRAFRHESRPTTLLHAYLVSRHYGPRSLVPDPVRQAAYLAKLGPAPARK